MYDFGVACFSLCNTAWASEPLYERKSTFEWLIGEIDGFSKRPVVHFLRSDQEDLVKIKSATATLFLAQDTSFKSILGQCQRFFKHCQDILWIYTDCPINDLDIWEKVLAFHQKHLAEYTFMENYPKGYGADVLSRQVLAQLHVEDEGSFHRNSLQNYIHKNIHQYDVEAYLAPCDIRHERLSLICDSQHQVRMLRKLFENTQKKPNIEDVYWNIKKYPQFMRVGAHYVELEITNDCCCRCDICPRTHLMQRKIQYMSLQEYKKLILDLKNWNDVFVLMFGHMGEPMLHPNCLEMIDFALNLQGIRVFLETNGQYLTQNVVDYLSQKEVTIIVSLDSSNETLYEKLRGTHPLPSIEEKILYLLKKKTKNNLPTISVPKR